MLSQEYSQLSRSSQITALHKTKTRFKFTPKESTSHISDSSIQTLSAALLRSKNRLIPLNSAEREK